MAQENIQKDMWAGGRASSGVPRGGFGVFKPPPLEIPKISVEFSIA